MKKTSLALVCIFGLLTAHGVLAQTPKTATVTPPKNVTEEVLAKEKDKEEPAKEAPKKETTKTAKEAVKDTKPSTATLSAEDEREVCTTLRITQRGLTAKKKELTDTKAKVEKAETAFENAKNSGIKSFSYAIPLSVSLILGQRQYLGRFAEAKMNNLLDNKFNFYSVVYAAGIGTLVWWTLSNANDIYYTWNALHRLNEATAKEDEAVTNLQKNVDTMIDDAQKRGICKDLVKSVLVTEEAQWKKTP